MIDDPRDKNIIYAYERCTKEEDSEISKEDKDDDKGGGTSDSLEDSQDNEYKNADDEFEYKYSNKVTDISIDFNDFLLKRYLPFNDKCVLDKTFDPNYTFHDFIKYHSKEYKKICNHVREFNDEIDRKIEEENKRLEEEEIENEI